MSREQWRKTALAAMANYIDAGSIVAGAVALPLWAKQFGYFVVGLTVGADVPASWTLIAETAAAKARGLMLIVSGVVGILFAPREKGQDLGEGAGGRFDRSRPKQLTPS